MESRAEALRRILEEAAPGLSGEDLRELAAHVDDAVEARVRSGAAEDRAIAEAVADLGDLRRIAAELRRPRLAEVRRRVHSRLAFAMLVYFAAMQLFMAPQTARVFEELCLPMPALLAGFVALARAMRAAWPLVVLALAGLGWVLLRPNRIPSAVTATAATATVLAMAVFAAAVCLPILQWKELQQLPHFAPP
jgi:hypothetical protein